MLKQLLSLPKKSLFCALKAPDRCGTRSVATKWWTGCLATWTCCKPSCHASRQPAPWCREGHLDTGKIGRGPAFSWRHLSWGWELNFFFVLRLLVSQCNFSCLTFCPRGP